eukprot:GHVS01070341.1.p1 GENE.GHVS01070341.1~~GHVS01070341.1.p1  ORF type:complete len:1051 (-),score=215.20 GHVS01070341.1:374-3526(-)
MDADVRGFLLALGYDVLIFVLSFVAWSYLRIKRGDASAVARLPVPPSSSSSSCSWYLLPHWIRCRGASTLFFPSSPPSTPTDSSLYLNFLQTSTNLFLCLSAVGLLIILPLNYSCSPRSVHEVQSFFDRAAAENASGRTFVLWVLCATCLFYSCLGYFFVFSFWKHSLKTVSSAAAPHSSSHHSQRHSSQHSTSSSNHHARPHPSRLKPESYTIMVTGIPRNFPATPSSFLSPPSTTNTTSAQPPPPPPQRMDESPSGATLLPVVPCMAPLALSSQLREHFDSLHPGQVVAAHLVLDYSLQMKEYLKLMVARGHLKAARKDRLESQRRRTIPLRQPLLNEGEEQQGGMIHSNNNNLQGEQQTMAPPMQRQSRGWQSRGWHHQCNGFNVGSEGAATTNATDLMSDQEDQEEDNLMETTENSCMYKMATRHGSSSSPTKPCGASHSAWSVIVGTTSDGGSPEDRSNDSVTDEVERYWLRRYRRQSSETANAFGQFPRHTAGIGFVSFNNKLAVEECLSDPRAVGCHYDWSLHPAPTPSDIVWENIHISKQQRRMRAIILNVVLILVSVIVVSPVAIGNQLLPLLENIQEVVKESSYVRLTLTAWVAPLILILINSLLLPYLIYYVACGTKYWLHSAETSYVLHGNIVYLILNILIVPLLSLPSIAAVIQLMYSSNIQEWSLVIGRILLSTSGSFALHYLLNSAFMSSASQLLQIPQLSFAGLQRGLYGRSSTSGSIPRDSRDNSSSAVDNSSSTSSSSGTASSSTTTTAASTATTTTTGSKTTTTTNGTSTAVGDPVNSGGGADSNGSTTNLHPNSLSSCNSSFSSTSSSSSASSSSSSASSSSSSTDWHFDFGYWYAFCLATFTLVMVFSVVVPLILPLGALFFAFKYRIDRYNFENGVWRVDQDSGGRIVGTACRYMLFAISFLQFCMAGFFIIQEDRYLTLAGILLFVISTVSWVLLLSHSATIFPSAATKMTTTKILRGREGRSTNQVHGEEEERKGRKETVLSFIGEKITTEPEEEEEEEHPLGEEEMEMLRNAYKHTYERAHVTKR